MAIGAGGSGTGCVQVWDITGQRWVASLDDYASICTAVFVGAEQLAVVSDRSNKLEVWNVNDWEREAEFDLAGNGATAIAYSPQRRELAIATYYSWDTRTHSRVSIWSVDTWQPIQKYTRHDGRIECVEYSQDGKYLATSDADSSITLVDLASERAKVVEAAHAGIVYSVAFTTNGEHLASAGRDNQVHIWNVSRLLDQPLSSQAALPRIGNPSHRRYAHPLNLAHLRRSWILGSQGPSCN